MSPPSRGRWRGGWGFAATIATTVDQCRHEPNSIERGLVLIRIYSALILFILLSSPVFARSPHAISAKAAVVMDASGTVLYSKFPKARLAPASTVKLVTAMVALDVLQPGDPVTVSQNAGRTRTIPPRLCPGEEMTVADLLHLALMKSINSAAVALAEAAAGSEGDFVVLMNRKAVEIGASTTLFANASGLPQGTQYSTANDLALIMKAALEYPLIREILAKKEYTVRTAAGRELALESSNDMLWDGQGSIIGKTGYTGNARHCFVAAIDTDKGPLYTAVLGARSRAGLWRSTQTLAELGLHPELAKVFERQRVPQGSRKPAANRHRAGAAMPSRLQDVSDLQMSRLQGVFSQKMRNN